MLAVFSGNPTTEAKPCRVSWTQAPETDTGSFSLDFAADDAVVKVEQFDPVDLSGTVTWNVAVARRNHRGNVVLADLAGFDESEAAVQSFLLGVVDYASRIGCLL